MANRMVEEIRVKTPEQVELVFELAGIGSRFLAIVIDSALQVLIYGILIMVNLAVSGPQPGTPWYLQVHGALLTALLISLVSAVFLGYYILFETFWDGQTPGKRVVGLKVIKDDGTPVRGLDLWVRNLLRLVDFLPVFYGVGIISIFLSAQNKRLGDHVAGTLVIKTRKTPLRRAPRPGPAPETRTALTIRLSEDEYTLIRSFLMRRSELALEQRLHLAHRIAEPLQGRMPELAARHYYDEEFLETVVTAYQEQHRFL